MTLDLIALSNVGKVSKNEVAITSTCCKELHFVRDVKASSLYVVRLVLLGRGQWGFLEVDLVEVISRDLVPLEQFVFAGHIDLSFLATCDYKVSTTIYFTVEWVHKVLRETLFAVAS